MAKPLKIRQYDEIRCYHTEPVCGRAVAGSEENVEVSQADFPGPKLSPRGTDMRDPLRDKVTRKLEPLSLWLPSTKDPSVTISTV